MSMAACLAFNKSGKIILKKEEKSMSDTEEPEEEILAIDFMGYLFTKEYFEK